MFLRCLFQGVLNLLTNVFISSSIFWLWLQLILVVFLVQDPVFKHSMDRMLASAIIFHSDQCLSQVMPFFFTKYIYLCDFPHSRHSIQASMEAGLATVIHIFLCIFSKSICKYLQVLVCLIDICRLLIQPNLIVLFRKAFMDFVFVKCCVSIDVPLCVLISAIPLLISKLLFSLCTTSLTV